MEKQEEIGALYDRLVAEGRKVVNDGKYKLVDAKGIEVLSYVGKDFHEFGCTEEQAGELLHVVVEYFRKQSK